MKRSARGIALISLVWVLVLAATAVGQLSVPISKPKFSFVAYGDIRYTNPADTRASSPAYRRALVDGIAASNPNFVLISGDLVLAGGNREDWHVWEQGTAPFRRSGVPVFPVIGNHELYGDPEAANYLAQFPQLMNRRWYTLRARNVLTFMLDSSADEPGGEQWQWLEQQLDQVSADVDFLIIVLHNPPYTRSSDTMAGGGNSERPSEARLAAMLEQRQRAMRARMVVIAGHVHNYERYEHGGIMYLVSGGGGATPYTIPRQPGDFYRASGFTYHYLRFLVDGRRLKVEMHKLDLADGKPTWSIKDNFQLVAPRGAAAKAAGH